MKISLHIEAESAEEFHLALESLRTSAVAPMVETKEEMRERLRPRSVVEVIRTLEEEHAPVEPPVAVEAAPEPAAEAQVEEPVVEAAAPAPAPAAEPAERKRRGRKATPAPLDERAPEVAPAPAATKSNGGMVAPVTRDDFNAACRAYVHAYGLNFAQVDAPRLLQPAFGEQIRRSADVEDKDLARAIDIMNEAIKANPFSRKRLNA